MAWLLDNGASVNHSCTYGGSTLQLAIGAGKTEVAKLLIDRGVDVNHVHKAPTAEACGNEEIATLLRNKGAINDEESWKSSRVWKRGQKCSDYFSSSSGAF